MPGPPIAILPVLMGSHTRDEGLRRSVEQVYQQAQFNPPTSKEDSYLTHSKEACKSTIHDGRYYYQCHCGFFFPLRGIRMQCMVLAAAWVRMLSTAHTPVAQGRPFPGPDPSRRRGMFIL